MAGKSEDERLTKIAEAVAVQVDKRVDGCATGQVRNYVKAVIAVLSSTVKSQLSGEFIPTLATCIKEKIETLQAEYKKAQYALTTEGAPRICVQTR